MPNKPRGIIILEGADCSGKTTLAKAILARYPGRYIHQGIHKDIWRWHLGAVQLALYWADRELVVIDRLWLSEQAYGQTYRGGPAYDSAARCLDRTLLRAGAVNLLCVPKDLSGQLARHAEMKKVREEKFKDIARVAQLYYDLVWGNVAHPGETYLDQLIRWSDYTQRDDVLLYDLDQHPGGPSPTYIDRLIGYLKMHRESQYQPALMSARYNVTGHRAKATHLIVGEAISPQVGPFQPRWPFTWGERPPSAATWLNHALHALRADETKIMMTNAGEPDDHLAAIVNETGYQFPLKVVALGNLAHGACARAGIEPTLMPHPQYYRRFRHDQFDEYVQLLGEALK